MHMENIEQLCDTRWIKSVNLESVEKKKDMRSD